MDAGPQLCAALGGGDTFMQGGRSVVETMGEKGA